MITKKENFNKDILLLTLIILCPFMFYLYNVVPKDIRIWETSWFVIDSGYHEDVQNYIWILFVKFLTLSILTIWFLTCLYNWKWVILIPVVFEIYKIYLFVRATNLGYEIELTMVDSLIYSVPYVLILILISRLLGYQKTDNIFIINHEINKELMRHSMYKTENVKELKKQLKNLKKNKSQIDKKDYLTKLITLRDQITI